MGSQVDIVGLGGSKEEGEDAVESVYRLLFDQEGVTVPVLEEQTEAENVAPKSPFAQHADEAVVPAAPEAPPKVKATAGFLSSNESSVQ